MEIQLIDLPQNCLEEIFKKLTFAEISQLGATCKFFREISKTIFRLYFKNIEEKLEREMEKIENEAYKPESLSIAEHLHLTLLHSVLRILLSEAKMLNAHCWRYMRDPTYDFCFPAGIILDEFERILRNIRNRTLKKDMEPQITTTLFHLGETFYDYFDFKIENYFRESSGLEVKIISETSRQTFFPNVYNFVSNLTRESLLRDIHRYMRKHQRGSDENTICNPSILNIRKNRLDLSEKGHSYAEQGRNFHFISVVSLINSIPNEISCVATYDCSEGKFILEVNADSFPKFTGSNEKTLFGVKVLDILNCCTASNFHTLLLHNYENVGFKLKTDYELRDINVLEALPNVGLSLSTSEKQLNKICRYIRNNVRWTNLFHPLQDLWMLEDAIEINRDVETASSLLRHWKLQRTSSRLTLNNTMNDICQYNYRKIISQFKNRFGLLIAANLECPTLKNVPLKIQKTLENTYINLPNEQSLKNEASLDGFNFGNAVQQIDMEKWDGNISTYKFHLELKIQYPSFLSETVREAILKVDQIGEKTTVTTDGDDMRKSASYRVDDDNFDQ